MDENGQITKKPKDYAVRGGLVSKPMFDEIDCVDVDSPMHLPIRETTWYYKLGWNLNARESFPNNIPIMAQGKQKGENAALAVKNERISFRKKAREGPLKMVIDSPDPSGHGGL